MPTSTELLRPSSISEIQTLDEFSQAANQIIAKVNLSLHDNQNPFSLHEKILDNALDNWKKDPQHGIDHSFNVFKLMQELRDRENYEINDEQLFIRAIVHDLAEFLPFQREIPQTERSNKHNRLMRVLVMIAGKCLNIDDAIQLAIDIGHHDDFYLRPSQEEMEKLKVIVGPDGQLLADADRLVFDAKGSIDRNRKGSLGRWYFFRQDITNEDRSQWQPRTGGLYDGFSALALEFVAPDWRLYTESAKEMFNARKKEFRKELNTYYSESHQKGWQLLEQAQTEGWQIRFGLKNKDKIIEIPETQRQSLGFDELSLSDKIRKIVTIPVINKCTEAKKYFGYSVCLIDLNGKKYWLDPSILVFQNTEELQEALNEAIDTFVPTL